MNIAQTHILKTMLPRITLFLATGIGTTIHAEPIVDETREAAVPTKAQNFYTKAKGYHDRLEYPEALKAITRAVELEPENIKYLRRQGSYALKLAQYDLAEQAWHNALNILAQPSRTSDHLTRANIYNDLGIVCEKKSEYDQAIEYYEKVLSTYPKTLGENHPFIANTYQNLGIIFNEKADYDRALEYYEKALSIKQKTLSENHSSLWSLYNSLGLGN